MAYRSRSNQRLREVNYLANSAQFKMVQECSRPDLDLRHIVGHANMLDHLKHLSLEAHIADMSVSRAIPTYDSKSSSETTHSVEQVEDFEYDGNDNATAVATEGVVYPGRGRQGPPATSTVTVIACDDEDDHDSDDSENSSSDSDDGESNAVLGSFLIKTPSNYPRPSLSRGKAKEIGALPQTEVTTIEVS